jgi:hypothetical protein
VQTPPNGQTPTAAAVVRMHFLASAVAALPYSTPVHAALASQASAHCSRL